MPPAARAEQSTRSGIPGARNVDHAGIVVRDLDEATRFFVDVVSADLLFRSSRNIAGCDSN